MSDLILKKIISGPITPKAGKANVEAKNQGDFGKVLGKTIDELQKAQNQVEQAVAKAGLGSIGQLNDVREAIRQTNEVFKNVMQSRDKIVSAYQKMVKEGKKNG